MPRPHSRLPHHDGSSLYVSTQTPQLGDTVQVRLRVPHTLGEVQTVRVRSNPDREPRYSTAEPLASATTPGWTWWQADVVVENRVHGYRFLVRLADDTDLWVNARGVYDHETLDVEDFKLVAWPAPPEWVADTVLYQVFPDRFARSSAADARELPSWAIPAQWTDPVEPEQPGRSQQFYGGDLDGVAEHLEHLKGLGITTIYLTPFFAGRSNHRYDASNFERVDPLLGGDDALVRLVEAAHARGLKVIGDLTSNHSGDAHEWFVAAHGHPEAPESDFYYWLDDENTSYASWLGVPSLPKFNWNSAELRRRFIEGGDSVVAKWLKPPFSLDGWRIDVANMTGRYLDDDLNEEVRRTIRRTMEEVDPDTILLGESTNDGSSDFQGDAWHGAMTYANLTRPVWGWLSVPGSEAGGGLGMALGTIPTYTGGQLYEAHRQFTAAYPWRVRLGNMNALDTHDTPRFATRALPGAVPVGLGMAVGLPGIPVVWAGDEFGLTGIDGEMSRTPIPWDEADEASDTLGLYRDLIGLRREHPALRRGGMRWLHVDDEVLVWVREHESESVLVVAARSAFEVTLEADAVAGAGDATALFGDLSLDVSAEGIRLAGSGPAFAAWGLPGVLAGS